VDAKSSIFPGSRTEITADGNHFIIFPNRSLSLTGIAVFLAAYTVLLTVVGVGFLLAGACLVLPFAGAELAVIAILWRWLYRHAGDYETVVVDDDSVKIYNP
jgi:uncharacterized membrane protein